MSEATDGPWDMASAVGAVADFMGVSPYRVPDKVTAHDGVPWSMYSALEIAYKAGKEAQRG